MTRRARRRRVEVQPPQRVGLSRETHAVSGHPVARRARAVVERSYGVHHDGYAGGVGEGVAQLAPVRPAERRAAGRRRCAGEPRRPRGDVGRQPRPASRLVGHPRGDRPAQLGDAVAGARRGRQHGHAAEPVGVQQPAHVGEHALALGRRHGRRG